MTEDLDRLEFEIEGGLKRFLALHETGGYHLSTGRRWVEYSFDNFPPSVDVEEVLQQVDRWFRKRRKYQDQEEYRFAWGVSIPQLNTLPDFVDIELTRTGLSLFQPWTPPGQ